jgi:hypothetical protein
MKVSLAMKDASLETNSAAAVTTVLMIAVL